MHNSSDFVINKFISVATEYKNFANLLCQSLQTAKLKAQQLLSTEFFNILTCPQNTFQYHQYLFNFSKRISKERKEAVWLITRTNGHQEIDDRTNHFYWLIDQEEGKERNVIVVDIPWFSSLLLEYTQNWRSYLNTTEFFDQITLNSFVKNNPLCNVVDSLINNRPDNPSGWLTFNQFFAAELNSSPCPITNPFVINKPSRPNN